MTCPHEWRKDGHTRAGVQRWRCIFCGQLGKGEHPTETAVQRQDHPIKGPPVTAIERRMLAELAGCSQGQCPCGKVVTCRDLWDRKLP